MQTTWSYRRIPLAALFAALLTAAFLLVAPLSASAHDELVSADPAADTTVETLPAQLALTFSGDVLDAEGATMIQVTDPAGSPVTDGAPTVDGTTVTQPLAAGGPAGLYHVAWKVVSADGHPIAGEYAFTVTTGSAVTPTPTTAPAPEQTTPETSPAPTVTVTATPTPAATSGSPVWLWVLLIVAVLVVAGIAVWLGMRRRPADGGPAASSDDAAASADPSER
ncbi:copper resistance protein CopC [Microbacterium bovistercoris]|uniref:Copper resistance protein CopC n=1 Tax=Microbacterium bovistercoris TaxID=2293570 RepID=A0A371NR28_9MICO|nr:copper resistance CopC family protein [Microbacterium bovistercoris]REJ04643.1 copper resistance protein CopC [Microbacterium bovistercoris]